MYRLERQIALQVDRQTLWKYVATPVNLNELTPPDLHFTILSEVPDTMHDGLQLRYEIVLPLLGRQKWLTEIRAIIPGVSFTDVQLQGPYRAWHHSHRLADAPGGGTTMHDLVNYELPFGVAGTLAHELWVKGQLERIFDYRAKKLHDRFGRGDR